MLSPEFRRELIRLANRNRMDADETQDVLNFAEMMVPRSGEPQDAETADALMTVWKESFEDEP